MSVETSNSLSAQVVEPTPLARSDAFGELLRQREALWHSHPVVRWDADFALPTPMLDIVSDIVSQSIFRKRSGRGFYSSPCFGKSTAIAYLSQRVRHAYPDLVAFCLEASPDSRCSELDFYGDLLDAAGYKLNKTRPARERRSQLINLLWSLASTSGDARLLLFVDEAQYLMEHHWSWLKTVQNLLRAQGVWLVVVPFGQEGLLHERSALLASGRGDLVKRFLRMLLRFEGLHNIEQLEAFMTIFDEVGHYPHPGGWTFSQFFLPRAFEAGWRLHHEAAQFWEAMERGRTVGEGREVGMEWVCMPLQYYLTEYSDQDAVAWVGTQAHWDQAVASCDWGPARDETD
jgi:hypothetical protein